MIRGPRRRGRARWYYECRNRRVDSGNAPPGEHSYRERRNHELANGRDAARYSAVPGPIGRSRRIWADTRVMAGRDGFIEPLESHEVGLIKASRNSSRYFPDAGP